MMRNLRSFSGIFQQKSSKKSHAGGSSTPAAFPNLPPTQCVWCAQQSGTEAPEESVMCATWECHITNGFWFTMNWRCIWNHCIQTRKKNYNTKTPLNKKETSKHCNLLSRLICLTSSPMDSESLESFHWSACVVLYLATLTVGMRACRLLEFSEEASAIYFRSPWPPWLIIHHLILYISCIIKQVYLANINMI